MKKNPAKKWKFIIFLLLGVASLTVALAIFLLVRCLVTGDVPRALWETIPALVGGYAMAILAGVIYYFPIKKQVKNVCESLLKTPERHRAGEVYEKQDLPDAKLLEKTVVELDGAIANYIAEREEMVRAVVSAEAERAIACRMQREVVPLCRTLGEANYSVSAILQPSATAEGDYCDFFQLKNGKLCIAVGDIWGNGVSASLWLARVKELVRELASETESLADTVAKINLALCSNNPETLASTLFLGIFCPATGEIRYVSAGHPAPVVVGEHYGLMSVEPCAPLGLYRDAKYVESSMTLPAGRTLAFYTNGVISAYNENKEFYGYERLFSAVHKAWNESLGAEHIAKTVQASVCSFRGEVAQDEFAILSLYYPNGLQKMFRPITSELPVMRDLLFSWLKADPRKNKIYLACEEIFTNIVNHSGASVIHLNGQREGDSLVIRFTDDGEPFNPLQMGAEGKEFYDFGDGGMGMAIIRQIAGEIFYRTQEKKNVLTVRFPVYQGLS